MNGKDYLYAYYESGRNQDNMVTTAPFLCPYFSDL